MMYQPDSNDEMPEWLQDPPEDMGDDSKSEAPVSPQEEQTTPEDQPLPKENAELFLDTGWLDDFLETEESENAQEEQDDDTPDWLKNIRELKRVTGTLTLPDSELIKDTDWLEKLQTGTGGTDSEDDSVVKPAKITDTDNEQMEEFLSQIESESKASGEVPEWLQQIRSQQPEPAKQPDSVKDPNSKGWLESVRNKHSQDTQKHEIISDKTEEEIIKKEPEHPDKSTPDWLHGLEEKSSKHQAQKQEAEKVSHDLPEWLQDIMSGVSEEEFELEVPLIEAKPEPLVESVEDEITPSEDLPSEQIPKEENWVDQFKLDGIKIPQEELPDWVFEPSDTPEITEEAPEVEDVSPEAEEEPEELKSAEIPTWMDEYVPDSIADDVSRPKQKPEDIYKKGPFGELNQSLPLEPVVKKITPPNIPTQDILLTDIQEKHVSYIFDLIKTESTGQKIGSRSIFTPQPILQILIALALMIGVIFPLFGQKSITQPDTVPVNVQQVYDEIETLTTGDNVLVAVDYQAGFAAELENGAGQILNEILATGANISLISSNAIGPGLIDHLINSQLPDELQEPDQSYSSFGYISGGSAALLQFAEDPKDTSAEYFKENPTLSSISNIRDFSMVLVITDDLNNARSWLEQVQPKLTGNISQNNQLPFLMLTSSQLEALIHPYYTTSPQKLNGYISGLKGISQFETLTTSDLENDLWDGYSRGISVTFLILIIGSAYHFINTRFLTNKKQQDI
jgi:hypothetical protein